MRDVVRDGGAIGEQRFRQIQLVVWIDGDVLIISRKVLASTDRSNDRDGAGLGDVLVRKEERIRSFAQQIPGTIGIYKIDGDKGGAK